MQIRDSMILFSASDLVNYLECEHLTALDLVNLETPLQRTEADEQVKLIQDKGYQHEEAYLADLKAAAIGVVDVKVAGQGIEAAVEATHAAMRQGAGVIYQACLRTGNLIGYVDFLRRVEIPSGLGDYSYEVVDTKLSRSPRAKFILQLCLYSELLDDVQGLLPRHIHVVLGDRTEQSFRLANYYRYYRKIKERFLQAAKLPPGTTYPMPCAHCDLCDWRDLCREQWEQDDHLVLVANITRNQIDKLNAAGIETLEQLARLDEHERVPRLQTETLERLRRQAILQLDQRESGQDRFELIATEPGQPRGFNRLPMPDPGDLFFDMEGDPLEEGGLEYLFGVYYLEDREYVFRPFWAHDRQQERQAFRDFMAFVMERLERFPRMHIYHYAAYEETAIKRLMSLHGVCEVEVDNLLRTERLVDLYKVVREGLRVSEPRYSIKNLETFYMGKRSGEVTNAGASIVYYEHWKSTGDQVLLDRIRDYNEDDCRSTYLLREWLLKICPDHMQWFEGTAAGNNEEENSECVHEAEARLAEYRSRLLGGLPVDRTEWDEDAHMRELLFQLLNFHRRAAKPEWWAMFARHEMAEEELIDDPECIGAMTMMQEYPPEDVGRSRLYTYRFPEQEFKFKSGDQCKRADTLGRAGTIFDIDEGNRIVRLKLGNRNEALPDRLSIIPKGPINTDILIEAIYRVADSVLAGSQSRAALLAILRRLAPSIDGHVMGQPVVADSTNVTAAVIDAVTRLQDSYLFIQGPPGAGKTYTGSHVITALLAKGLKVGVSSNSHKAINNLLAAVETCAASQGVEFRGVKKSTGEETFLNGTIIRDVSNSRAITPDEQDLIAGTAWLFADEGFDQSLDYLFVDEAGQVSLANLLAMGASARNIVLLGDQMQLQQPIKGVHPGHSGESALDYLLQGEATIADDRGVFLGTTWRMHEDVCRFISDAVYDGRLQPEPDNQKQRLVLNRDAHSELRPAGIRFVPATHDGCSQRSPEEALLVKDLYASLLMQSYIDRNGRRHSISQDNILIVAPYNMQVNLLKQTLPDGARVGTVDKFQGQEAEVVIVSMATSSGEYLPRFMEFLYSKNRLNVALSRARCLALLVSSPDLMAIKCHTIEQMELVNTLCWVEEFAQELVFVKDSG